VQLPRETHGRLFVQVMAALNEWSQKFQTFSFVNCFSRYLFISYVFDRLSTFSRAAAAARDARPFAGPRSGSVADGLQAGLRWRRAPSAVAAGPRPVGRTVVGHYAQFHCSLSSDTRHSGEVMGGGRVARISS